MWRRLDQTNPSTWPPENMVVNTKVDDGNGVRNEQKLKRLEKMFWFPDGSMYIYYCPTHWRY